LRERGIHLALDDFGTGYSSLAYLKRFPINTLKIDKAFIDDIATSTEDRHMAEAIITIAHNLGLKVLKGWKMKVNYQFCDVINVKCCRATFTVNR
jgi:EAL domain-containing protein (putative c-di-GMP-specific phosphodiesterase class I)